MEIRNVFNQTELLNTLNLIIEQKNISHLDNIKSWIFSNAKNYFLKNSQLKEINKENLDTQSQKIIEEKNILPPYHHMDLNADVVNQIKHIIDYLKTLKQNDLSRLSYSDALLKSNQWISEMIQNFSDDDDLKNVIPLYEISHQDKKYTWVNLRSEKALQRESKLMSHCIASYWDETMTEGEPTQYYSLRDENNKPFITLNLNIVCNSTKNSSLFFNDFNVKHTLNILKIDDCKLDYETKLQLKQSILENSNNFLTSNYITLMNRYNHPDTPDNILINSAEVKEKYNEGLKIENAICVTKFINNFILPKINSNIFYQVTNSDGTANMWENNNKLFSFEELAEKNGNHSITPTQSFMELTKFFSPKKLLSHCYFDQVSLEKEIPEKIIHSNCFYLNNSSSEEPLSLEKNQFAHFKKSQNLNISIYSANLNKNHYILDSVLNSKFDLHLGVDWADSNSNDVVVKNFLILNNCSENNKITIQKQLEAIKKTRAYRKEIQADIGMYVVDYLSDSSFINESPLPIYHFSINNGKTIFNEIKPTLKHETFSYDNNLTIKEHYSNIIQLIVDYKYNSKLCIEKEILSNLNFEYCSKTDSIQIHNLKINSYDFFNKLISNPNELSNFILAQFNKKSDIEHAIKDIEQFKQKCFYFLEKNQENKLFNFFKDDLNSYDENITNLFNNLKQIFKSSLEKEDDYALTNFVASCQNTIKEKNILLNSFVFNKIKNDIIDVCQQVDNRISNSILSNAKTKIRETRKNNMVNFVNKSYLNKNQLHEIFGSEFDLQLMQTNKKGLKQ